MASNQAQTAQQKADAAKQLELAKIPMSPQQQAAATIPLEDETRVTPMVTLEKIVEFDAEAIIEEARLARKAELDQQMAEANDAYQYYVKCRRGHGDLPSHGIYLTRNPGPDAVKPSEWWAVGYKPKTTDTYFADGIMCQICLMHRGEKVMLDVDMDQRGWFTVRPRWLWRRPKDPKRARVEGETRASDLGPPAVNFGRREAMERSADAGLTVIP